MNTLDDIGAYDDEAMRLAMQDIISEVSYDNVIEDDIFEVVDMLSEGDEYPDEISTDYLI